MAGTDASRSPSMAALRAALKRISPLRSLYYLGEALLDVLRKRPSAVADACETLYAGHADPWNYVSEGQQGRYRQALAIVDAVLAKSRDARVLEIGCGEGAFSELLATRPVRLLCVDVSPTALARARERLAGRANVEFRQFDILADGIAPEFDLVVMDHVIDMFHRRAAYRYIAGKIAAALKPDGRALIGAMRGSSLVEAAWWSRPVLRGGAAILDWIGRRTALEPVETAVGPFYLYTLFKRRA